MKRSQKHYCNGCDDNYYNHGNNSTTGKCWCFQDAKIIWRCMIPIDVPPSEYHRYKKERMPDCYNRPRYSFPREKQ